MNVGSYSAVVQQLVLPTLIFVIGASALVSLLYAWVGGRRFRDVFGFSIAFGFLGGTAGLIAGATSEPIVGAFLTGLLGIVSGTLSLLFVKQVASEEGPTFTEVRPYIAPAIVVLCLTALAGLSIGRVYQTDWVHYEREYAEVKSRNEAINMPLRRLWLQYDYCRSKVKDPSTCDAILYREQ